MSEDTATTRPRQFARGALETLLLVVAAFPFAMWRAIPTSDSYGRSASLFVIGGYRQVKWS